MNLNNIKPGQTFANYLQLCKSLELEPKTNNSKKAQLKELYRFVDYEQLEGTKKYRVYEIREVPIPKARRKGNHIDSLYFTLMVELLDNLDEEKPVTILKYTSSKLQEILGMYNNNYFSYKDNKDNFIQFLLEKKVITRELAEIHSKETEDLFDQPNLEYSNLMESYRKFYYDGRSILSRTLKRLLEIVRQDGYVTIDELYQVQSSPSSPYSWATKEQLVLIKTLRAVIISEMGYPNEQKLMHDKQKGALDREFKARLEKHGIFNKVRYYEFGFTRDLKRQFERNPKMFANVDVARLLSNVSIWQGLWVKEITVLRVFCVDNFILLEDNSEHRVLQ